MLNSAEVCRSTSLKASAALLVLSIQVPTTAFPRTAQDELQSFVGQPFILARVAGQGKIKLRRSRLNNASGSCDLAAQVEAVNWKSGTAQFRLKYIGTPVLINGRSHGCQAGAEGVLELSGFAADEPPDALLADIHKVLQTPEEFLAERGIPLNLPPAPEDEHAIKMSATLKPPVPLLRVDGEYTPAARSNRVSGSIVLSVVVGSDGRVHRPKVTHPLRFGLDENALKVMPLWRLQPALQDGKPVAVMSGIQMSFRIL